jgi:acyl carrier protein
MPPLKEIVLQVLKRHLKRLEDQQEIESHVDLRRYGLNSMASVSILLDIEEEVGIEIPDTYLTEETFKSADTLYNVVSILCKAPEHS